MDIVRITNAGVRLVLTNPKSKVRIADENGNHPFRKPASEVKNIGSNYIEWMIKNSEIEELITHYLNPQQKSEIKDKVAQIKDFLQDSKYDKRMASKKHLPDTFKDFKVYELNEMYYSFEKMINSEMGIKLTFKEGDFRLAVNLYVLLNFSDSGIEIKDKDDVIVAKNELTGSKSYAIWHPTKKNISDIIEALSHASPKHKQDLIDML